jgi:hypothetical protein
MNQKMNDQEIINIYLGSINRSGANLFCRLLDGHPEVASYPTGLGFPNDNKLIPGIKSISGRPRYIPNYNLKDNCDYYKFANIPKKPISPEYKWGREKSDSIGVRKNYLEREFYNKVKTDFDSKMFYKLFDNYCNEAKNFSDIWNYRHIAYFNAWENNRYSGTMKYVVYQDGGGLYIKNHSRFFENFKSSFWLYPIRNIYGYIASEKTRLAKRYYGSRRFPKYKMPNYMVKIFNNYDLNAHINSWLSAFTRVVLFQEKYGIDNKFIIYSYENLVNNPEDVMQSISKRIGLEFNSSLLNPTIAGNEWGGSSHQGRQKGINPSLSNYHNKVLRKDEIYMIDKRAKSLNNYLGNTTDVFKDLTGVKKTDLYDYEFQNKYFKDEEKIAMYSYIINSGRRDVSIKSPSLIALVAYFYSKIIRIIHIPRLLKLRLFPGKGKQNYT